MADETQEEEKNEEEESLKKKKTPLSSDERKVLQRQVEMEYQLCWGFTQEKRVESLRRLKLYNNQKRDKSKVGDPLIFAIQQTVLATLYDDRLTAIFQGREEGDEETAENLTAMAEHDHGKMEKDELDYEWDWDACFFGEGYMLLNEFDRRPEMMCPVAEVLDPMILIRDPRGTSVNGNQKGYGSWRFWGREIGLSKSEMEKHPSYFNLGYLKKDKDTKNLTQKARQARREAQGLQQTDLKEEGLTENYEYSLLEWFTHINGEMYLTTWGNNRRLLVRYQKLDTDQWPLIDRKLFPLPHESSAVSIPDLIEDKQRARSVMINLGMESAIADLYPMYLFDKKKITNPGDLDFAFNKYIPTTNPDANTVIPIQKSLFHQQVNLILNMLDIAAQKAVATPEISQGVQPSQARTLGESELIVAGKDVRHSLGARIFGWSEKRFWRQCYWLYKKNFKEEIDEKIIRIQGPLAPIWRTLTKENLIAHVDPDVYIESASIVEAKRREEFQKFSIYSQITIQDPRTNRPFVFRKMGSILGIEKSTLTLMFPPTIDEMRAEDENQNINGNKLPKVNPLDDDIVHIEIHNKGADTPAKLAHIEAHKQMMMYKKEHPEQFPQPEPVSEFKPVTGGAEPTEKAPAAPRSTAREKIPEEVK